jgi:2-polyprenyl-3-methyl-5-hydroxy-6-metoxy-1,4-benzoquinol methylase
MLSLVLWIETHMFSTRLIKPELLDDAPPEIARANLRDLLLINRRFGGLAVIRKTMRRVIGRTDDKFTLLDIGAASGDSGRTIKACYPQAVVISFDHKETNLEWAEPPKIIGDAFRLPFKCGSVDVAFCSLFLHHFRDHEVVELIRDFHKICRRALVICDLERHVIPYLFLPATRFLFKWQEITLHDGPISVRAAFRAHELLQLCERAGIKDAEIQLHRPAFRLTLIARKEGVTTPGISLEGGPVGTRR